ncbi:hypothetical protein [Fluviicola taffensis]|nr:hypothetical protein [Fluviicola taffensis]
MKPNILNWLRYSSVLVFVLLSCKKEENRIFDDFQPGRFDFIWISDHNGIKDTLKGEVSGPYHLGGGYFFRKHLTFGEDNMSFMFSSRSNGVTIDNISIYQTQFDAKISNYTISDNNLNVDFNKQDTLIGSFNLTRI